LPVALEVGMTPFQFWCGDIGLLDAYIIAYNNRVKNTAILNGLYTYIAVSTVAEEILSKQAVKNYVEKIDYMETMAKANKETKETFDNKVNYWATIKQRHEKAEGE
jgi:phage gp36-like protein